MSITKLDWRYSVEVFLLVTTLSVLLGLSVPYWSSNEWDLSVSGQRAVFSAMGPLTIFAFGHYPALISGFLFWIGMALFLLFCIFFHVWHPGKLTDILVWSGSILWNVMGKILVSGDV